MPKPALLVYIADIYCPWCYGFAPIMQRLASENPDIPVHVLGGDLIARATTLAEDAASNPNLVTFWKGVEQQTGRSLAGAISAVEKGASVRLYSPGADEILTVLTEQVPDKQLGQLIYLEDLFYAQGKDLFAPDTLAEIAAHWQIPADALNRALDSEGARAATDQRLEEAAELMGDVSEYPTLLLVRGLDSRQVVSRGYVPYETAAARLKSAYEEAGLDKLEEEFLSRARAGSTGGK